MAAGTDNMLDQGAIRAFQYNQGLTMDGVAGPQFWAYLLKAAAQDQRNPNGYSYALATQGSLARVAAGLAQRQAGS